MNEKKNALYRVEIITLARFLFCEGCCAGDIDNVTILLDGRTIGSAEINFVNFRNGTDDCWKYEDVIPGISPGSHKIEALFKKEEETIDRYEIDVSVQEGANIFRVTEIGEAEEIRKEISEPDIIFLEHPNLHSPECKNLFNKKIFEEIHNYLKLYGYELILVTFYSKKIENLGFRQLCLPEIKVRDEVAEAVRNDSAYKLVRERIFESTKKTYGNSVVNNCIKPLDENRIGENFFTRAVQFECLLQEYKPKLLITWCEFNARTPILRALSDVHDIPSIVTHEGFLPQTLQIDTGGEIARSYPYREHGKFQMLEVDENDLKRVDEIIPFAVKSGSRNKQAHVQYNTRERIMAARKEGKRVLLYIGCNDWLMGMRPIWLGHEESKSSPFIDSYDALNQLMKIAEKNHWHLICKPHPHYNSELLHKMIRRNKGYDDLTITYSGDIYELLPVSDALVTLMSTASYEAMMCDVPVVLVGIHPMTGKGIAYECVSSSMMEDTIKTALNKVDWHQKKQEWRLFLARMIKYYLFPQSNEMSERMGKSIDESARYILKRVRKGNFSES